MLVKFQIMGVVICNKNLQAQSFFVALLRLWLKVSQRLPIHLVDGEGRGCGD